MEILVGVCFAVIVFLAGSMILFGVTAYSQESSCDNYIALKRIFFIMLIVGLLILGLFGLILLVDKVYFYHYKIGGYLGIVSGSFSSVILYVIYYEKLFKKIRLKFLLHAIELLNKEKADRSLEKSGEYHISRFVDKKYLQGKLKNIVVRVENRPSDYSKMLNTIYVNDNTVYYYKEFVGAIAECFQLAVETVGLDIKSDD